MNKNIIIVTIIGLVFVIGGGMLYANHKVQQVNEAKMMQQNDAMKQKQGKGVMMHPTDAMMGKSDLIMMGKNAMHPSFVTAANDMTLYTFDNDGANQSTCTGGCATTWSAYLETGTVPTSMPAHLGAFKRTDGSMQYTWDNKPLYFYSGDKKVGDTNGDGIDGVWHIAK